MLRATASAASAAAVSFIVVNSDIFMYVNRFILYIYNIYCGYAAAAAAAGEHPPIRSVLGYRQP